MNASYKSIRCVPVISRSSSMRGFTLVEFLVAMAIGMVVVIAASYVYLATRDSQRTLTEKSAMFENARFAMETIGRDIENAGFYPALRIDPANLPPASAPSGASGPQEIYVDGYTNPCLDRNGASNALCAFAAPPAFTAPVFGCAGQRFERSGTGAGTSYGCVAHPASTPADTVVVSYYTNDAEGLDVGQRADCQRQDAANSPINALRKTATHAALPASSASGPFMLPDRPFFVTNAYTLQSTTLQQEGRTVNTFSLACNGSGNDDNASAVNVYQPMVQGIDQLRFTYLVRSAASTARYLATSSVTNWSSVVGVRVCLMARSLENVRLQSTTTYTLTDCDGTSRSFSDGAERRVYTQIFALKNALNQ